MPSAETMSHTLLKKTLADKTKKSKKFPFHIYKTNKNSPIFGGLI
jgi:hypothetical protein